MYVPLPHSLSSQCFVPHLITEPFKTLRREHRSLGSKPRALIVAISGAALHSFITSSDNVLHSLFYPHTTTNACGRFALQPDASMGGNVGDEPPLSPGTQETLVEVQGDDDITKTPLMSSLFLGELWGDNTSAIYSYNSTWSSNYTASNLPGPGRNLGNFYSWAGSFLDRRLRKRAERAFIKEYEDAVDGLHSRQGIYVIFSGDKPREVEKICEIALICARSYDVKIQVKAFKFMTELFILYPPRFRSAFGRVLKRRKGISDVFVLSWKRPSVEYSFDWLFWYNMASRCLTSQKNAFVEAAVATAFNLSEAADFSNFEEIVSSCGDATDLLLALQFLEKYWSNGGVQICVRAKGVNNPALNNLAIGLMTHWAMYFSQPEGTGILFSKSLYLSIEYVYWMMLSLRGMDTSSVESYELPIAKWENVFKLHYILRSSWYYKEWWWATPLDPVS
ncbi:hypothetical protein SCHPADRAFT_317913 [Schizopora paradoxa]|uniref:Uncharacterized protein n=1 Tax=Schizopora paradoxa TaxID=27342 RepID=A0A0H2RXS8_9AGAM|nr:hypothetical protein SCHPADRAFT_317913 [Schizopora paradoxa]